MDNPWIGDLDRYVFYCCPECNEKSGDKNSFIGHAVESHSSAKLVLSKIDAITTFEESESMDIEDESEFDVHIKDDLEDDFELPSSEVYTNQEITPKVENQSIPKCVPVQNLDALKDKGRKFLFVKLGDLEELQCSKCREYFPSKKFLKKHKLECHPEPTHPCNSCEFIAKSEEQLNEHEKAEHEVEFKCDQCDYVAPTKLKGGPLYYLNTHKIRKHGEHDMDGTKCFKCGVEFMNNKSLIVHLLKLHDIQVSDDAPCEFCGKSISKKTLDRHLRYSHGVIHNGFMCLICDKLFKTKEKETDHMVKTHKNDLKCDKCDKTFDTSLTFDGHIKECFGEESKKTYTCKECQNGYEWCSTKMLELHWVQEHKVHKKVCKICGVQERNHLDLKNHIKKIHDQITKHQCHHCGKHFLSSSKLNVHLRKAHNEMAFIWKCQYCQKELNNASMLKDHINAKHEQSERHQCDKCTYSTWYKYNLSNHIKVVHLNIRTVTCDYCEDRFVSRRDRNKHMASKHGIHVDV